MLDLSANALVFMVLSNIAWNNQQCRLLGESVFLIILGMIGMLIYSG